MTAAEKWPQLPDLWRFCRRWDAIVNRGIDLEDEGERRLDG